MKKNMLFKKKIKMKKNINYYIAILAIIFFASCSSKKVDDVKIDDIKTGTDYIDAMIILADLEINIVGDKIETKDLSPNELNQILIVQDKVSLITDFVDKNWGTDKKNNISFSKNYPILIEKMERIPLKFQKLKYKLHKGLRQP